MFRRVRSALRRPAVIAVAAVLVAVVVFCPKSAPPPGPVPAEAPPPPAGRLAVSHSTRVLLVDPNTGAETPLATVPEDGVCWLRLSPDGRYVAWAEWHAVHGNVLRVVGTDGREVRLDPPVPAFTCEWAWRPDGRLALPARIKGKRTGGWLLVDPRTGGVEPYPDPVFGRHIGEWYPIDYFPDGRVLFNRAADGAHPLAVAGPSPDDVTAVTTPDATASDARLSPDGKQVVYERTPAVGAGYWVARRLGLAGPVSGTWSVADVGDAESGRPIPNIRDWPDGGEHHRGWCFSPCGRWLAVFVYGHGEGTAEQRVDVLTPDGTHRRTVWRGKRPGGGNSINAGLDWR